MPSVIDGPALFESQSHITNDAVQERTKSAGTFTFNPFQRTAVSKAFEKDLLRGVGEIVL